MYLDFSDVVSLIVDEDDMSGNVYVVVFLLVCGDRFSCCARFGGRVCYDSYESNAIPKAFACS